jgi:diguanylate cyclase (GGDEF)-like protein
MEIFQPSQAATHLAAVLNVVTGHLVNGKHHLTPDTPAIVVLGLLASVVLWDVRGMRRMLEVVRKPNADVFIASLDSIPDEVVIVDERGTIVAANAAWREFGRENGYRATRGGIGDSYMAALVDDEAAITDADRESVRYAKEAKELVAEVLRGTRKTARMEYPCFSPGEPRWFEMVVTRLELAGGTCASIRHANVSQRVLLRRELNDKSELLRAVESGLTALIFQKAWRGNGWEYEFASGSAATFLGYAPTEIYGSSGFNRDLLLLDEVEPLEATPAHLADPGGKFHVEDFRMLACNGDIRWVRERTQVRCRSGSSLEAVGILLDVTDEIMANQLVQDAYEYDPLTRLRSRRSFEDAIGERFARFVDSGRLFALIAFDIDGFREINEVHGFDAGDDLLKQMARVAEDLIGPTDVVGRLGPDTFAILVAISSRAEAIAILDRLVPLDWRFSVGASRFTISVSAGLAIPSDASDKATNLLLYADMALQRAKEAGGNTYRVHSAEMSAESISRVGLKESLKNAIAGHQFVLTYQPEFSQRTGQLVGCEALIRWDHPEFGRLSPARFIPLAEKSGLIVPIGEWVIREAARQYVAWRAAGVDVCPISVNVSAVQLTQGDFPAVINKALADTGAPPHAIRIELTESVLLDYSSENLMGVLERIHAAGIEIELDDFGTGYSSLPYLKKLPLAALKIDQGFVQGAASEKSDAAIVRSVIQLAAELGLKTIGEGAETAEHVAFLRDAGCDEVQGYFFSTPLSALDFGQFLSERTLRAVS